MPKFVSAAIACLMLAGATSALANDVRSEPRPALWSISDIDTTIYLFGSSHMLRSNTDWQSTEVLRAFDSASEVWFEVDNQRSDSNMQSLIARYGVSTTGSLSERLNTVDLEIVLTAARYNGMTLAQVDMFDPWLASMTLGMGPLVQAGYSNEWGVETIFGKRALQKGTEVHGFQTLEQQIQVLENLSQDSQISLLRYSLIAPDMLVARLDHQVSAWTSGNIIDLAKESEIIRSRDERLYEEFLVAQNTRHAGSVEGLLEKPGTIFVALGAMYLAGPDSVLEMLNKRGIAVTRIQ